MVVVVIDLILAALLAVVGGTVGWWLRGGHQRHENPEASEEARRAREVLGRLHDLAARVAAEVGEHSHRVEEINEELISADVSETEAVVSAVRKLVEANGQMQKQLASAEEKLQEQAQQIESHATQARTDALTRLANRRAFDDEIARRFAEFQRYGRTFSLVMVDVDHFKKFNDRYGHQAGDDVLRGVAGVLRKNTRSPGLPARYGGEEFAVIFPGTAVADANTDAERIRAEIENATFQSEGTDLHVTASLGVANLIGGEEIAGVIKRADAALYASKEAGRNCAHWHDGKTIHPVAKGKQPQSPEADLEVPQTQQPGAEIEPATAEDPQSATDRRAQQSPRHQHQGAAEQPSRPQGVEHPPVQQRQVCDQTTFCTVLNNRLAEWRRGGVSPSIIFVQIDNYQAVASTRGKQTAQRVLGTTMQFLKAAIRDMDLVAYYDLATFALLLPGAGLVNTIRVAERLRQAIAGCTLPLDGAEFRFTVSAGGAEANVEDDTHRLLERAQQALAAAVQSGGNCSYFHNGQWSDTASFALEKMQMS